MRWRSAAAAILLLGSASGQTLLTSKAGVADGDALGLSVAMAGDVDKDGHPDLVVGAPGDDANGIDAGIAWVYSGKTGAILYMFRGAHAGDSFGYAVRGAGDVNDDGYDDVVIGAPYEDNKGEKHTHKGAGSAQVFSGRDGAILYTLRGTARGDALGWSVGSAGDVNRDGHEDMLIGAPFADRAKAIDVGVVHVVSGKTGEVLRELGGGAAGNRFGWSVCSVGDLDGDRAREILIGSEGSSDVSGQSGHAQLFSGKSGRLMRTFRTGKDQDYFGTSVASAGDVDGDRRDDLIIGGWNGADSKNRRCGVALVFSGRTGKELHRLTGIFPHDRFGASVASLGDVDGDGRADLAVGAPQEQKRGHGYVTVFSGKSGELLFTVTGGAVGDSFGTAVWGTPDRNGDGVPDLVVGSPGRRKRGAWLQYASPAPKTAKR